MRATGDAIYPVVASVGSFALVLGVGSYFLGHAIGLPGIFIAYAADEWVRGLLMFVRWRWHGWVPHARNAQRRVRRQGDYSPILIASGALIGVPCRPVHRYAIPMR